MPETPLPQNIHEKPAREVVDDILEQSQAALQSSARAAAELQELTRRADEAMDWRAQLSRHSWLGMGLAIGASIVVYMAFFGRRD